MENKKYVTVESLKESIITNCDNPDDYQGYVENCLLYDPQAAATHYQVTVPQFEYYCASALREVSLCNEE